MLGMPTLADLRSPITAPLLADLELAEGVALAALVTLAGVGCREADLFGLELPPDPDAGVG